MKYRQENMEPGKLYFLLGERIRQLRKSRCMTQEELSLEIGSTQKYVSSIERGLARPSLAVCLKIANALHVSIDALLRDLIVTDDHNIVLEHMKQSFAEDLMQVIRKYIDNR